MLTIAPAARWRIPVPDRLEKTRERMRREAHEKLDEILDNKVQWRYPLVVTITVEGPAVRSALEEAERG